MAAQHSGTPAVGVLAGFDADKEDKVVQDFLNYNFERYIDDGEDITQKNFCNGTVLEWALTYDQEDDADDDDDDWGSFDPAELLNLAGGHKYPALAVALLDTNDRVGGESGMKPRALRLALMSWLEAGDTAIVKRIVGLLGTQVHGGTEYSGRCNFPEALGTGGSVALLDYVQDEGAGSWLHMDAADAHTALLAACRGGHLGMVQRLVQDYSIHDLGQALVAASTAHDASVVEWLLDVTPPDRVDVGKYGVTALQRASCGNAEAVRALLALSGEREIDVRAEGSAGWRAALRDPLAQEDIILEYLALPPHRLPDLNIPVDGYDTLYHFHSVAGSGASRAVAAMLAVPPPHSLDLSKVGGFALNQAASAGHTEVARMLLEEPVSRGLDVTWSDCRLLRMVTMHGHVEVVRLLLALDGPRTLHARQSGYQAFKDATGWAPHAVKYPAVVKELLLMTGARAIPHEVVAKHPPSLALLPDAVWEGGVCRQGRRRVVLHRVRVRGQRSK